MLPSGLLAPSPWMLATPTAQHRFRQLLACPQRSLDSRNEHRWSRAQGRWIAFYRFQLFSGGGAGIKFASGHNFLRNWTKHCFANPLCRLPILCVIQVETPSHRTRPAHAQLHWPGYGELARCQNSPQQSLSTQPPVLSPTPTPLPTPVPINTSNSGSGGAAGMMATTITTRHLRQLLLPLRLQHLRRSLQATAARRPRVASQT